MWTPGDAASGDRLLIRWFSDDRLGTAFGCVFATGEFGGALAFYLGWFLSERSADGYKTVFLVGAVLSAVAAVCLVYTWFIDRDNDRVAIRVAQRSHVARSAAGHARWALDVVRRQTTMFWICFGQVMCFYCTFYTFVAFMADFLVECYGLDVSTATLYAGVPCGFSLVLAPLSGYVLDRFGHRDAASEL